MKIKYCAMLTVINGLLLQWVVIVLFLPLVAVIQHLSGGEATGPVQLPWVAHVMLHPAFGILFMVFAIAVLGVSIRGAKRETTKRGWWILLVVVNALALLMACTEAFALPKFMALFNDMGIK